MTGTASSRSSSDIVSRVSSSRFCDSLRGRLGIALCLAVIIVFVSYPLFALNAWYPGEQDLVFHLARIEGIKEGLLSGQFPVKIEPPQLNGAGYANGVFYPDMFLYLSALLCIAGMDVVCSWNVFLFALNCACCLIAYWCFKRMFASRAVGVVGAFLYTAGFYRLMDVYLRSALGEHIALIFFPLAAYGMWRLYSSSSSPRQVRRAWVPLTIAFVGIMQSHVLSVEIVGIFVIVVALVRWRRTFTKPVLFCWLKVVLLFLLLDLFFLVPFLDYMRGSFSITDPIRKTWTIQSGGMNPLEYLIVLPDDFFRSFMSSLGFTLGMPLGIGSALLVGAGLLIWLILSKGHFKVAGMYRLALVLGLLALWMSTCLFPWDCLESLLGPLGSLVSNIQFPWRFLGIATLFLVIASCGALTVLVSSGRKRTAIIAATVMVALTATSAVMFMNRQIDDSQPFTDDDLASYLSSTDYGSVGNGEYLPGSANGFDQDSLVAMQVSSSAGVQVSDYRKEYLNVFLQVSSSVGEDGFVDLPLIYYEGYAAVDLDTGQVLDVEPAEDDDHVVRIAIPAGYDGSIEVAFVEPWYWRVAEGVSALALIGVMAGQISLKIRRRAGEDAGRDS